MEKRRGRELVETEKLRSSKKGTDERECLQRGESGESGALSCRLREAESLAKVGGDRAPANSARGGKTGQADGGDIDVGHGNKGTDFRKEPPRADTFIGQGEGQRDINLEGGGVKNTESNGWNSKRTPKKGNVRFGLRCSVVLFYKSWEEGRGESLCDRLPKESIWGKQD